MDFNKEHIKKIIIITFKKKMRIKKEKKLISTNNRFVFIRK